MATAAELRKRFNIGREGGFGALARGVGPIPSPALDATAVTTPQIIRKEEVIKKDVVAKATPITDKLRKRFGIIKPEVAPEAPRGFVKTAFKEIVPTIKRGVTSFFERERERRARQTFREEAVTELVERPAKILKFATVDFPRLIVGGLSEAGKTIQEAIATPIVGSEEAQKLVRATAFEEKVFGFKPQSFADYTEGIQKFLNENPDATETEKKVLPLVVPAALFGLELTGFGGRGRKPIQKLFTEIAELGSADEIFDTLRPVIKGADDDVKKLSEGLVKIQDPKEVENVLGPIIKEVDDVVARKVPDELRAFEVQIKKLDEPTFIRLSREALESPDAAKRASAQKIIKQIQDAGFEDEIAFFRAVKGLEGIETRITKELESLAEEARKFDTVKEFTESLSEPQIKRIVDQTDGSIADFFNVAKREIPVELESLAVEARKFDTAEEFVTEFQRVIQKGRVLAFEDPLLKAPKITKEEEILRQAVFRYAEKPEIKARYDAGATDKEILTDFFNQAKAIAPGARDLRAPVPDVTVKRPLPQSIREKIPGKETLKEPGLSGLVESNNSFTKNYNNTTERAIQEAFEQELSPVVPKNPGKTNLWQSFRRSVSNSFNFMREQVQDDMLRVKALVENPDVKITDASDPYQAEILFHGRVGSRLEETKKLIEDIDLDIVKTSKAKKIEGEDLTIDVNRFLIARHAPERNAQLGDGAAGVTTADAKAVLADIKAGPNGAEIERIANLVQEINNRTLDVLLAGEVIDQELYTLLRKKYKNHVPLQRIFEEDTNMGDAISRRGFDVSNTGIRKAKGSEREVADILENVTFNYEQAIIRSEKNRVDLSTLQMVRDNKKILGDVFEEVHPPIVPVATEPFEKLIDPVLHNKLLSFAEKNNIEVINKRKLSRGSRKLLGLAESLEADDIHKVSLRIASDENTFAHEIGHSIDLKFKKFDDKKLNELDSELKKIALRRASKENIQASPSFETYLLSRNEKVAEAVSMFINDAPLMSRIAPKTKAYFKEIFESHEAMKDILDMKPSRQREIKEIEATIFRPKPELLINDPQILVLREKGKPVFLKINDPNLAVALRGVGRQKLSGFMRGIAAITRFYSGLQTRFNPEFAFPNKIRDVQEVMVYAASKEELGFKGAGKVAGRELRLENEKAVFDWIREKDTEGARIYQQMKDDGGTTGGLGLSTRQQIELDMKEIRKINRSKPRDTAVKIIRAIDHWNSVFEDSTRLSVYRQALDSGATRRQAARFAKESSVNFNKTGIQGPILNGMYMFANASIQGSTKMLMAMKNPKVAGSVSLAVFGAVAAVNEWNDTVDPEWRKKITEWDRLSSLPIMLPNSDEDEDIAYITIPVSWGIKPLKVIADQIHDTMSGHAPTLTDALGAVTVSIIEGYNPAGGTDVISAVTPTVLDLPIDIGRNRAWHGGAIKPDWDRNAPASIQYFDSLRDSTTGRMSIATTNGLSGIGVEISPADVNYAYEQLVGGAGRTANKTVNTVIGAGTGDFPRVRDIPIISRFLKTRTGEEAFSGSSEYEKIKDILSEQSRSRFILKQQAEQSYSQFKDLETEEAAALFDEIRAKDPELAEKIADIKDEDEKGLSYTDRLIKALGVENGERAKYLATRFNEMETQEQKAELWAEFSRKKLISKTVGKQLRTLLAE